MTEATISQIRSLSGIISDPLFYILDEGKQGMWQYSPGSAVSGFPDNTGTILNTSDGKVIKRIYSGPVNVKWFGAKGDGSSDDTAAIQLAIDALINIGGAVFMPAGNYFITNTLAIKSGISLIGEETQNSTINSGTTLSYAGTGIAIQCYKYINDPAVGYIDTSSNIIIKGFFLRDSNNTGSMGLDLQGFRWCKLENVAVYGFEKGLHTNQNYYATYRNLIFNGYRKNAIHAENQDNNTIWEKIEVGNASVANLLHAALFSYAYNINLTNFSCETNTTHGVNIEHCRGVVVAGFYYEATAPSLTSALLLTSCQGVSVTGGAFQGGLKTLRGIFGSGTDDVMITGNWFNGFTGASVVNGSVVLGDNKNFLQFSNKTDELNGDYDRIFDAGQGGGELIGFRHVDWCMYDNAPTSGDWKRGDILWRKTAETGKSLGFICTATGTPGTWVEFGQMGIRTSAGTPVSLVPNFIGEEVLDTVNGKWYKSTGLSSGNWVALN
jgi:hypothetical protein